MASQNRKDKKTDSKTRLISDMFSGGFDVSVGPAGFSDVYRRFERISASVFFLSSAVQSTRQHHGAAPSDVLFKKTEEAALAVLEEASHLSNGFRDDTSLSVRRIAHRCVHLTSLIRMLAAARCVSVANTELLVRATEEALMVATSLQDSSLAEDVVFTRDDLIPLADARVAHPNTAPKETVRSKVPQAGHATAPRYGAAHTTEAPTAVRESTLRASSNREEVALSVLRKFGALGIKDIAVHMPDCGEKTVQRLLASLTQKGLVRKEGEKRWSKYHVV